MKRNMALGCAAAIFCVAAADAQPFKTHSKSNYLDFEYSWPPEVGAVPALVRHFTQDLRGERRKMLSDARDASHEKDSALPFRQYSFYRDITTAGQTARLLSLKIETYEFTGGAHGVNYSAPFLWDRQRQKEISFRTLLADRGADARLLRNPFCHRLSDQRTKRNGEKMAEVFEDCPKLSDLTILPGDADGDGRFDDVHLIADPGVAGSNAEGTYDISLPVTARLIAAISPEYRGSFKVQRQ
jgi:hypothetical protein